MAKKSEQDNRSEEQKALEARVDKFMSGGPLEDTPKPEAPKAPPVVKDETPPKRPDVLVIKDSTTAPELPKEAELNKETSIGELAEAAKSAEITTELDDSETEKAVDDIIAKESDLVLAVEDAKVAKETKEIKPKPGKAVVSKTSFKDKLRHLAKSKKTWVILALILIIIFAVPASRYKVLGLAIKKPVTITIVDSKTGTPVSEAKVMLGGVAGETDNSGKATIKAPVGSQSLTISKQYYRTLNTSYFVGFKAGAAPKTNLEATGRLVPITVINKITGKPLAGVEVKVLDTTAKTNSKGLATIALPATAKTRDGKLSFSGYNTSKIKVEVTDAKVKANSFEITPAGRLYFLSNRTGKLDVVRTNLDGSERKVILEGTGNEEKNTTSLLASRDWRYLVLKSKRDTAQASLYLIDTTNDKVTQFDSGDATFDLIGWYDHSFIYSINRNSLKQWQTGKQIIKSYDAERQQLNQLDQANAEGDATRHAYQNFSNFYIVNNAIVYTAQWFTYAGGGVYDYTGKNDAIRSVGPTGQNKKDHQSFPTATTGYMQAALYAPQEIYFAVFNNTDNKVSFYEFEELAVKTASITQSSFDQSYPTFLLSPSGKQTFWTELRDGKNTLFTGNNNAENKKQIASLTDYSPYGWFGDNYTLVSKNASELYIMPATGPAKNRQPLKVTDYYRPAQTYNGYGYGYGGL